MVIPVTPGGQVVFVRQFRHGARRVVLEVPGGVMDGDEMPEETARRELLEETGFSAASVRRLGTMLPNPAIHSASCHVVLAEGCCRNAEPDLDPLENIDVLLRPRSDVPAMIRNGELCHALVNEMREQGIDHEERVVTMLSKAFMWVRSLRNAPDTE